MHEARKTAGPRKRTETWAGWYPEMVAVFNEMRDRFLQVKAEGTAEG